MAAAESEAFACWAKKYTQQIKLMLSTQLIEDLLTTFNVILPAVSSMLLFGLAVYFTQQSPETGLSTGTFLAFNTAFATFITSATRLSNTLIDILDITILWERAQPILKTQPEVDRIYVLESGRIVQQGSFEELAAVEGLFADLMARQMT